MMKTNRIYALLTVLCLFFLCFCHMENRPLSTGQEASSPQIPSVHTAPSATASPLSLYAAGACLMDAGSGRILYGKSENEPLPMASTTKIMTCLLALEYGTLSDTVTFSAKAASMPKVHLGASENTSFLLEDLLYSLMLESHNDTAVAIAEHIGGSTEGFAAMMNEKAAELGMTQTTFVTPNGLDADGHRSTPADMCRLAAYACQNETFLKLIQTSSFSISDTSGKKHYTLTNHDAFLTSYDGAIGIKTGFTGKAGYCFVGAATRDGFTLVSCVLASGWPPNKSYKWADTKALMDFGFKNYTMQTPVIQDLSSCQIPVTGGTKESVGICTPQPSPLLLSDMDETDIAYSIPSQLQAPVKKDTAIGTVSISVNGTLLAEYPLFPSASVAEKQFVDFFKETCELFLSF